MREEAWAVREWYAGAPRELAYSLLEALLDDAAERGLSPESQLAALDDAMLMALDLRDGQAMRVGILSRYAELGLRAADQSDQSKAAAGAWSSVRPHYQAAPVMTQMQLPTDLSRVVRWELISDAYRGGADATRAPRRG